jgi:hypothetical protein
VRVAGARKGTAGERAHARRSCEGRRGGVGVGRAGAAVGRARRGGDEIRTRLARASKAPKKRGKQRARGREGRACGGTHVLADGGVLHDGVVLGVVLGVHRARAVGVGFLRKTRCSSSRAVRACVKK